MATENLLTLVSAINSCKQDVPELMVKKQIAHSQQFYK